mmetsp:Transcript_18144/g.57971  ORF Transcript_18144/g.57971 Transcript_18144/m.57971 type:complete len:215 (-) Transcript_18144:108-752(-)
MAAGGFQVAPNLAVARRDRRHHRHRRGDRRSTGAPADAATWRSEHPPFPLLAHRVRRPHLPRLVCSVRRSGDAGPSSPVGHNRQQRQQPALAALRRRLPVELVALSSRPRTLRAENSVPLARCVAARHEVVRARRPQVKRAEGGPDYSQRPRLGSRGQRGLWPSICALAEHAVWGDGAGSGRSIEGAPPQPHGLLKSLARRGRTGDRRMFCISI